MKSSKMKEVLLKKRSVLEDICRASHIVVGEQNSIDFSIETIECGKSLVPLHYNRGKGLVPEKKIANNGCP